MTNIIQMNSRSLSSIDNISISDTATLESNEVKSIKSEMIRAYLTHYLMTKGPCPCPEMTSKNGYRCGARSAWSRITNKGVLCYPTDIDDKLIKERKDKRKINNVSIPILPTWRIPRDIRDKVSNYISSLGIKSEASTQTDCNQHLIRRRLSLPDIYLPNIEIKKEFVIKKEPTTSN